MTAEKAKTTSVASIFDAPMRISGKSVGSRDRHQ
jgi:hypothetical protein